MPSPLSEQLEELGCLFRLPGTRKYPNKIKPSVNVSPRFDGCLREVVAYENSSKSSLTEKMDFKRQEANRWSVTEGDQSSMCLTVGVWYLNRWPLMRHIGGLSMEAVSQ